MWSEVTRRGRVAVLLPYWDFWAASVGHDLRADREALLAGALETVGERLEVVLAAVVASRDDAALLDPAGAEAVLVVQTMAVPPAFTLAALDRLAGLPVVVWALTRRDDIPAAFDHGAITEEGATVGTPMLTSALVRSGRPFELVLGTLRNPGPVTAALVGAAAATRIRSARIGRVGRPFEGYDSVTADAGRLAAATGVRLVDIDAAEFRDAFAAVSPGSLAAVEAEARAAFEVDPGAASEGVRRSFAAVRALESVVERHRLSAGAINCHLPEIRFGPEVGIAPCYALGSSTTRGVPWTCAGDVVTAFAMLAAKLVGAAALYHELEVVDHRSGEMVIANSGEHDLAFARPGVRPRLRANGWFAADPLCGVCACFPGRAGPATLVAFAQLDRPPAYRLIVALGSISEREWPEVGTPNAGFTFARGIDGWLDWCRAGATHHSSATPGDFSAELSALGRFLGVEVHVV